MGTFKSVTNIILNWFEGSGTINQVTSGDIQEVDLSTHTEFPLSHVIYLNTTYNPGYNTYNYQILLLDTFNEATDERIDIIDVMNEVATQFVSACNNGSIFNSQIRITIAPNGEIMYDQLQNRLYGISLTISLQVPTGIINCG